MLVSRLLPKPGVDVCCESSFLVRFGSVLFVRIVGLWIAVWHSDVFLFGSFVLVFLLLLSP